MHIGYRFILQKNLLMKVFKFLFHSEKFRYLLVGTINTLFGYFFSIALLMTIKTALGTVLVAILSNLISITFSFAMYKIFVFNSQGNWIKEYIKFFMIYLNISIVNVILLFILIDFLFWKIWISQLCVTFFAAFLSYISHKKFTFNPN